MKWVRRTAEAAGPLVRTALEAIAPLAGTVANKVRRWRRKGGR